VAEAYAYHLLSALAAYRTSPDVTRAEPHCQQATALAHELGMRPLPAHCALGLGGLNGLRGRLSERREVFSTAIAPFNAMGLRSWLTRAQTALAELD
jgi:hypothetical protein